MQTGYPETWAARQHSNVSRRWFRQLLFAAVGVSLLASAHARQLDIRTATIAEVDAAFAAGLTAERLVKTYLARIEAYDKKGPKINAVITLNPRALAQARALDAERKAGRIRGPLHGIPVVLKDNIDTFDLPTTAGSQLLATHIPASDAALVKKLREAGAIIVGKVNLAEFAGSGGSVSGATDPQIIKAGTQANGVSTAGGQTRNPHDLQRGPSGSSGGTGAAIAAVYAQFGLGTDTGGSVRGPSSHNGIVGLKTTHGLISRAGIVPLALTLDTAGPMARSVYDVAASLGVMTGVDPEDPATLKSAGRFATDYTRFLKVGALQGVRLGIARDFMGKDPGTERVMSEAITALKRLGAVIVDPVGYPEHLRQSSTGLYNVIVNAEFKAGIAEYLRTTGPAFPKSLEEIVARVTELGSTYRNPAKAVGLRYTHTVALTTDDPVYLAAKNEGLAAVKASIDALLVKHQLDAIVFPTLPTPAVPIVWEGPPPTPSDYACAFANQTGYPELSVPAGMTPEGLPVTISFFGRAFSEPQLLAYGYDFEQATRALVLPKHTPALASDVVAY